MEMSEALSISKKLVNTFRVFSELDEFMKLVSLKENTLINLNERVENTKKTCDELESSKVRLTRLCDELTARHTSTVTELEDKLDQERSLVESKLVEINSHYEEEYQKAVERHRARMSELASQSEAAVKEVDNLTSQVGELESKRDGVLESLRKLVSS